MFKGWHERSIDSKGRLSIPSRIRDILIGKFDGKLTITNGWNQCLVAYPCAIWEEFEKKVSALPQFSKAVSDLKRVYISSAQDCELDKQGRIIIPQTLRDYAKLDVGVMIIGQITTIEIWDKKKWQETFERSKSEFDQSKLAELGL